MHLLDIFCLLGTCLPTLTNAKCFKHGTKFSQLRGGPQNHTVDDAIRDFCETHEVVKGWAHSNSECYNFPGGYDPNGNHLIVDVRWFHPHAKKMPGGIEGCIKNFRKQARGSCEKGSLHRVEGTFYKYCDILLDPGHGPCPMGEDRAWPLKPGGDYGLEDIEQPQPQPKPMPKPKVPPRPKLPPKESKPPSMIKGQTERRQGGGGVVAPLYPFNGDVDGVAA
ncbi:hypothetical protein DL546_008008 [Coniochaeta pulveracea]|uniref:Uncharacterized protein n=1 Tax=Coniochaeta pulveracea TaxID=177199 RepID=A0A420YL34_9PEZI|nr:hypothetical protein DL546_008008 [Coniochaeta pulveracea]